MSRNYTASTRDRIGDLVTGMRIDTSVAAATATLVSVQQEVFNVYGRIMVLEMYLEVISALGADATTVLFNYTSATAGITAQAMCAASTDVLTSAARGFRMQLAGGAITNVATMSATEGVQDEHCTDPQIIGCENGTGTVGVVSAGANATDGTIQYTIHYIPMSDGAYVTPVF
jgi:hypothetical protein